MENRIWKASGIVAATVALWAGLPGPSAADEAGEEERSREVTVEVVEDGRQERRVIVVDAEGESHGTEGDHPVVWVGEDGYGFHFGRGGAFLGVELTRITPELRAHFGVPEDRGVLVARVVEDSPAARADIRTGDVLAAVDGEPVESSAALVAKLSGREAGDRVDLELWRDGHPLEVRATLEERNGRAGARRMLLHRACAEGERCGAMGGTERHRLYSEELCGDREHCNVTVQCSDEGCVCRVNGDAVTCPESMK